jgi:hypothetical protein
VRSGNLSHLHGTNPSKVDQNISITFPKLLPFNVNMVVNYQNYEKSLFLMGKSTINGQFSIAMFVYRIDKPWIIN